jgi:hypothetical protein
MYAFALSAFAMLTVYNLVAFMVNSPIQSLVLLTLSGAMTFYVALAAAVNWER